LFVVGPLAGRHASYYSYALGRSEAAADEPTAQHDEEEDEDDGAGLVAVQGLHERVPPVVVVVCV